MKKSILKMEQELNVKKIRKQVRDERNKSK